MSRTVLRSAGFLAVAMTVALVGLRPASAADLFVTNCADSPAVDAGDNATCETTDQRGVRRPLGANGLPATCDIGAVEAEPLLVSTGTGPTGGPHVKLFAVTGGGAPVQLGGGFFAYDMGFTGGVQAAFANTAFGLFVVTGVGSGGGPHIKLFRVNNLQTGDVTQIAPGFMAYDLGFTGGARVAATTDADGNLIIVTGVGSGGGAHVKVFQVNVFTGDVLQLGEGFFAYDPAFTGGVNVGAGKTRVAGRGSVDSAAPSGQNRGPPAAGRHPARRGRGGRPARVDRFIDTLVGKEVYVKLAKDWSVQGRLRRIEGDGLLLERTGIPPVFVRFDQIGTIEEAQ